MKPTSYTREPAVRLFAKELAGSTESFKESNDDKAPTFHKLVTGGKANRILISGPLIIKEKKDYSTPMYVGKITDPTGTFYVNAGSYQPEAMQQFAKLNYPCFVTAIGKINSYETDKGNVMMSVRLESITETDESTVHQWILDTADLTLKRLEQIETTNDTRPDEIRLTKEKVKVMVHETLLKIPL